MTTQLSHPPNGHTAPGAERRSVRWTGAVAVAIAAVAAAVAVSAGAAVADVALVVETGGHPRTVTLQAVVVASIVGAGSGVLLFQLALRLFVRGRRWWTLGAVLGLLASMTSPTAATSAGAWFVLSLMHVVVGAVTILGLRRLSRNA